MLSSLQLFKSTRSIHIFLAMVGLFVGGTLFASAHTYLSMRVKA